MKIKFRRYILIALSLLLFLQAVYVPPVFADSNDLRKQFIELAKGKSMSDIDTNAVDADSLRIIALYLSNFFIPFGTTLDGEDENGIKDKMTDCLISSLNFDKDTAKFLVEAVYTYSLNTAKPLVFKATPEQIAEIEDRMFPQIVADPKLQPDILNRTPDGEDTLAEGTYRMTYGAFMSAVRSDITLDSFWVNDWKDSSGKVAFGTNAHVRNAYAMYAENLPYKGGIGNSLFTVTSKEAETMNESDIRKILLPICQLYVDWVGNIIMDDGQNRIILLPACMNPYTFKAGKDGEPGGRVNGISVLSLNRMNKKKIVQYKDSEGKIRYKFAIKSSDTYSLLNDTNDFRWHGGRGEPYKDNMLDENWIGKGESAKKLRELIVDYIDFREGEIDEANNLKFPNWGTRRGNAAEVDGFTYMDKSSMMHTKYVWVDNLQEYDKDKDDGTKYFKDGNLQTSDGDIGGIAGDASHDISFSSIDGYDEFLNSGAAANTSTLLCIYLTYLFSYANYQNGDDGAVIDTVFCGDLFPNDVDSLDWGSVEVEADSDAMTQEIMSMVYYILHPSEGMRYVSVWAKNKISGFLLGWHEDMTGAGTSNVSTGMTRYIGFTGYTTLPSLNDLSWTNWLLENYNSIIVYLIIIISIILCCYVIVGHLTGQRALIGAFMFAILAFFPPVAINMAVNIVNTTCDTIYGNKFSYWALVQHQSYMQELYQATTGTKDDYRDFVLHQQAKQASDNTKAAEQTDNNYAAVKLKWMSPKKDNYMADIIAEAEEETGDNFTDGGTVVSNFMKGMLSKTISGEDFLDSPEALYLYRDYMNITMYSLKSYNLYSTYFGGMQNGANFVSTGTGDYKLQVGSNWQGTNENKYINYNSGLSLQTGIYLNYESGEYSKLRNNSALKSMSSVNAIRNGFLINTLPAGSDLTTAQNYYGDTNMSVNYALNFVKAYDDIYKNTKKLTEDMENGTVEIGKQYLRGYGLPQNGFNFTQSNLSKDDSSDYTKNKLDYFYYGLYSESPYYYMTYNILDQMKADEGSTYNFSTSSSSKDNFKKLLLGDNLSYFYNYAENAGDGYGELRDFMNMHDFFWYILPLMDYGNQLVDTFDSVYGMTMYDDVKVRFTADGYVQVGTDTGTYLLKGVKAPDGNDVSTVGATGNFIEYKDLVKDWTDEKVYKFWHNYNVATIFNAYCTWADTMYDCDYAKAETIKVAGKKFRVGNPLDPTSYFETDNNGNLVAGRPMVFSKSEMKYYGLETSDLTRVEKKIIAVQDSVYKKSIDLMNYYTFDDDVLVSAYAMLQLFEFNKEFSQTSLVSDDYVMYPQGYELKAFTYDAYLRLIITNTTGDDLQVEDNRSIYERTMENTSITFGIILLILDVMAVYIIPAFKLFFLIALFFMSILMIVASAVKIELNLLGVVWKSLISPLVSFSAVSIGLAFVVSLFMYNGAKGVTGDLTPTISLGDPTMVVIVMVVINALAVYLYFKICRQAGKDFVKYAKAVGQNIGGAVAGALKKVTGLALAGKAVHDMKGSPVYHNARQSGKRNMPRPHSSNNGGSSGDANGGSDIGAGMALGGGAALLATGAKKVKENNAPGRRTAESYNEKMKSGQNKVKDDLFDKAKERGSQKAIDESRRAGILSNSVTKAEGRAEAARARRVEAQERLAEMKGARETSSQLSGNANDPLTKLAQRKADRQIRKQEKTVAQYNIKEKRSNRSVQRRTSANDRINNTAGGKAINNYRTTTRSVNKAFKNKVSGRKRGKA